MSDKIGTGKFTNTRSVPCSPVTKQADIKPFLQKTPIPKIQPRNWIQGVPTPIKEGSMTPNTEAMNLLTGFATSRITVEEGQLKHLPTISESLNTIWETPKRKKDTNGGAIHTKKAKIAQKEPCKNISKQLAQQKPHTKIPDSEIKLENIIPGSPAFIPYKHKTPMVTGKGKDVKNIKLNDNENSDSDMARTKRTVIPKSRETEPTGKAPRKLLATKAAYKEVVELGVKTVKPHRNYAIIAMREIHHYQKSIDLLIPLLPFQRLIQKITQDFRFNLRFQSRAKLALQEAAEMWLVQLFESANLCTIHRGHQTIAPKDFYLVKEIYHIAGINMWWKSVVHDLMII